MKTIAYYGIHYGSEWLEWSMRSIEPYVDDILVLYSDKPSHGHGTDIPCPDSKQDILSIANKHGVVWAEMNSSRWEGDHRDQAVETCFDMGADIVMVVDHDEIWESGMLQLCLRFVKDSPARNYLVHMQHYWRSVSWVCYDECMPVRFHKKPNETAGDVYIPREYCNVHHYGYAQSSPLIAYKWLIHGHLGELRPNWYQQKFLDWKPGGKDVHPTNYEEFWNPVPFDKTELVNLIGDHPYYNLGIIP